MKVLVDTSVWSRVLRNSKADASLSDWLERLVKNNLVTMIGPIRQELLSGVRAKKQFNDLKYHLAGYEDHIIRTADYELAAEFYNHCRKKGVQGSHVDFLICACAVANGWHIFTLDKDFKSFDKYLPIELYSPA